MTIGEDWLMADAAEPSAAEPLTRFFEATDRGVLAFPFCDDHGHPLDFDQVQCEQCGGETQWRDVEPSGRVLAAIVMHRIDPAFMRATAPYPVVEVEFGSGHRLYVSTSEATDRHFEADEVVELVMVRLGERNIPRVLIDDERRRKQ